MTMSYEQTYQLRTGDFDTFAHLQPASILDIFQDAAGAHADRIPGMSAAELGGGTRTLLWVITRLRYEVLETPALHEQVHVRTWPLAPTRVGFQRECVIESLDDTPLVRGSSEWVLMDAETRGFASARDAYDGPNDFSTETVFDGRVRRLRPFDTEGLTPCRLEPMFTDIDVNGHVNNTKYANFVLNALKPKKDEVVKTFQIDYHHEIHMGENISVYLERGDGCATALGVGTDGEHKFLAQIEFA